MADREGDSIMVKDTSNGKLLEGTVVKVQGATITVFVKRFNNKMDFIGGVTTRGRFRLVRDE